MSEELINPGWLTSHAAVSLMTKDAVNGLIYNRGYLAIDMDDEHDTPVTTAPLMTLLYSAGTVTEHALLGRVQVGQGATLSPDAIQQILLGDYREYLVNEVALTPAAAVIVAFTREAYRDGVALEERRNEFLKAHRAPLAAIALHSSNGMVHVNIHTPYFSWPWTAFRAIQSHLS